MTPSRNLAPLLAGFVLTYMVLTLFGCSPQIQLSLADQEARTKINEVVVELNTHGERIQQLEDSVRE